MRTKLLVILAIVLALASTALPVMADVSADRVVGADSSATALGGNAAFTGDAFTTSGATAITVAVYADQASAASGLSIQQSKDGTNWDRADAFSVSASTAFDTTVLVVLPYARVVYTNGATTDTALRLTTTLRASATPVSRTLSSNGRTPVDVLNTVTVATHATTDLGGSTFTTSQVSVTVGATLIVAANPTRSGVTILNLDGTNSMWVGPSASVTSSNGYRLKSGESIRLRSLGAVYGVYNSATVTADVLDESN